MLTWIREHLEEEARSLGIAPRKLTFLKRIGGDLSPGGKAIFEVLGPLGPEPLWVIKAARTAQGNPGLQAEYQRLEHLSRILSQHPTDAPTPPRVPHPILFEERPHGGLSIETFLAGERLSMVLQRRDHPDPWAHWEETIKPALEGLHAYSLYETKRSLHIGAEWWKRRLIEPLTPHYGYLLTLCEEWPRVWAVLQENQGWCYSGESVPQHGDFTPANLVLEAGRIGVFDWSLDDVEAPPLMDLIQFLASSSQFLGRRFRSTDPDSCPMLKDHFLKPAIRPVFHYLRECGLGAEDLYPLSLASLGIKILNFLQRPDPAVEYLAEWVWTTQKWILEGGAKKLISFVNDEDFA